VFKLFNIHDANTLIPAVDATLQEMQAAARDLTKLQATLADTATGTVRARNIAVEMSFLAAILQEKNQSLVAMGVFVSDLERGLVLFPSQLGAEVIHLSWQRGEPAITHYHDLLQRPGVVNKRLPLPAELVQHSTDDIRSDTSQLANDSTPDSSAPDGPASENSVVNTDAKHLTTVVA
jgi:hypothetical protein